MPIGVISYCHGYRDREEQGFTKKPPLKILNTHMSFSKMLFYDKICSLHQRFDLYRNQCGKFWFVSFVTT